MKPPSGSERGARFGDRGRLGAIVGAGIAARLLTLWVGRAEFTGWLNHTYYYFVQVRGLVDRGTLPYDDMPLIFHLYAGLARVLMWQGMEASAAIVASTRVVMCAVPALIALPIYGVARTLNGSAPIRRGQWVVIAVAAFLPLSLSYLPEFLQKNMLGLLLLATLVFFSQRLLRQLQARDVAVAVGLMFLILVLHYGTAGAMVLYGVALFLADSIVRGNPKRVLASGSLLALGGGVTLLAIRALDAQRFRRIFIYLREALGDSLLVAPFRPEQNRTGALMSLAVVLGYYALLALAYRIYRRRRTELTDGAAVFWLAHLIFCGLLVIPLVDQRLMARLSMFARIPLLIVLLHLEQTTLRKPWLKTAAASLIGTLVLLTAVGEVVSSKVRNSGHQAILTELEELRDRQLLQANDLVVARTGAEHVCNWFYGVKAGVITSLRLQDFATYDNIYVMNPLDGQPSSNDLAGRTAESESERYDLMFRNIALPAEAEPVFTGDHLEVYRIGGAPAEWLFAEDGRWYGYASRAGTGPQPPEDGASIPGIVQRANETRRTTE